MQELNWRSFKEHGRESQIVILTKGPFQMKVTYETFSVVPSDSHTLHVKRIYSNPEGEVVLLIHGAMENGRIFYSLNEKGLAPYLARQGYDVYIPDLRGHGESKPTIGRGFDYGHWEVINEDFPALTQALKERRGTAPQTWMSHSWGGFMMLSYFAKYANTCTNVKAMAFFGARRLVSVHSVEKYFKIDLIWNSVGYLGGRLCGYMPSKEIRIGPENEARTWHHETVRWIRGAAWKDFKDGFPYGETLQKLNLPPMFFMTGANDKVLGNPTDAKKLIKELNHSQVEFRILGKKMGAQHDYDHVTLLTHPAAQNEHFPALCKWMKSTP
jgi:predicted alpha/beta hydrolase